jgi:hypothetical protein
VVFYGIDFIEWFFVGLSWKEIIWFFVGLDGDNIQSVVHSLDRPKEFGAQE